MLIQIKGAPVMSRFARTSIPAALALGVMTACAGTGGPAAGDAPPPTWPASRWNVVAMADDSGRLVAVRDGVAIDLAFDAAATQVTGSAGCNRYSAAVTLEDRGLRFGAAAASKRMCVDPGDLMALEARFLRSLGRVALAVPQGARVALQDAEGGAVMLIARAPAE